MNKQALIAGLIGAASAATPCDGPFVTKAEERKVELAAAKVALEGATAGLTAAATAAKTAFDTAAGRVAAQGTLMADYLADLNAIKTAKTAEDTIVSEETTKKATATTAETAATTALSTANTAVTNAQALVTAQQVKVTTAYNLVISTMETKAQKAKDEAVKTQLKADADTASTTAASAWTDKNTEMASNTGSAKLATDAATAYTSLPTATTTAVTNITNMFAGYKAAKWASDVQGFRVATMTDACVDGSNSCITNTSDPIKALKDTLEGGTSALTLALTAVDTAGTADTYTTRKTEYKNARVAELKAKAVKDARDEVKAADDVIVAALLVTKNEAAGLATDAANNLLWAADDATVAAAAHTNAVADKLIEDTELARLAALVVPLTADASVKAYLLKLQTDAKTAAAAAQATATPKSTAYGLLQTSRQTIVDDYQTQLDFLTCAATGVAVATSTCKTLAARSAEGLHLQAKGLVDANAAAIVAAGVQIAAGDVALAQAIAACKGLGYEKAMDAKKALQDKVAADAIAAAAVKTAYDAKAAFGTGGAANTPCAYTEVDGSMTRPACLEGLCCGAAQKFLRDGTKLAVETCQAATGVHVYTYYPPLPAGATAEPTPETWRFQCISGAQKLFAAATAALAASAMMA